MKRLENTLKKLSNKIATSYTSTYYTIDNIIVRVSDHYGTTSDFDLTIYYENGIYVCIPGKVLYRKIFIVTNIKSVLEIIDKIKFHKVVSNPPGNQPNAKKKK
jgi:hypothetical protein